MTKPGKAAKWAARSERLAAALRENLKRRKAQTRERTRQRNSAGNRAPGESVAHEEAETEMPRPDFRRNRGAE